MWEINRALKELEADGLHPLLARGVFLPDGCRGMRRKGLVWMKYTTSEVLQFIKENDVKFIRLAFCDLLGVQKNVSIMAEELPRAFSAGISFDASAIAGFMHPDRSDLQ